MFKTMIAPIQAWLMLRGQCVGCGSALSSGQRTPHKKDSEKVVCKCGRIFIYDQVKKTYRRALFSEI
jgi:hypothetical protein